MCGKMLPMVTSTPALVRWLSRKALVIEQTRSTPQEALSKNWGVTTPLVTSWPGWLADPPLLPSFADPSHCPKLNAIVSLRWCSQIGEEDGTALTRGGRASDQS